MAKQKKITPIRNNSDQVKPKTDQVEERVKKLQDEIFQIQMQANAAVGFREGQIAMLRELQTGAKSEAPLGRSKGASDNPAESEAGRLKETTPAVN